MNNFCFSEEKRLWNACVGENIEAAFKGSASEGMD
jgi:hypothetical protein